MSAGTVVAESSPATEIEEPLEEGYYDGLELDAGETLSVDAELEGGDEIYVVAIFPDGGDLEVTIDHPSGEPIGEEFGGDDHHGVHIESVPDDGTYTVEITNHGDTTFFDLEVVHEQTEFIEPEDVPEPLEPGDYTDLVLDDGETATFEAVLTAGDAFQAVTAFEPSYDVELAMYDPAGEPIGEEFGDDDHHGTTIDSIPEDGTYTVEITNHGEATVVDFIVNHAEDEPTDPDEVPDPLEPGEYSDLEIDSGETIEYDMALTEGDGFQVITPYDPVGDLELTVYDPDGAPVGESDGDDNYELVLLEEAPADGTYTVELTNGGEDTLFELIVNHAEHEPTEPDEVPDPLEPGQYTGLELAAEETVTHDVVLGEGDTFFVNTPYDPAGELELTLYGPDGTPVGDHQSDDGYAEVFLESAPEDGTYTVEIHNLDQPIGYELTVDLDEHVPTEPEEIPDPLEGGFYADQELDAGETVSYEAELDANDVFFVGAMSEMEGIEVAVTAPDGTDVGTEVDEETIHGVVLLGAAEAGTYTVDVTNTGEEATTFDLEVGLEDVTIVEPGVNEDTIGPNDVGFYLVDVTAGDDLTIDTIPAETGTLDVALLDGALDEVADPDPADGLDAIEYHDIEADGTYLLTVFNTADGPVEFDLDVTIDDADTGDDPDDRDEGDDADDSDDTADEGDDADDERTGADDSDEADDSVLDDGLDDSIPMMGDIIAFAVLGALAAGFLLRGKQVE